MLEKHAYHCKFTYIICTVCFQSISPLFVYDAIKMNINFCTCRLEPTQLQSARQEFEQELTALRPQDSLVLPQEEVVQLPNQPQLQFH